MDTNLKYLGSLLNFLSYASHFYYIVLDFCIMFFISGHTTGLGNGKRYEAHVHTHAHTHTYIHTHTHTHTHTFIFPGVALEGLENQTRNI